MMQIRNSKFEIRNKSQNQKGGNSNARTSFVWSFFCFFLLICFAFRISNFAFSSPPTSQPDPIFTWFSDLANRDASIREQARVNLMGISRDDLETLRKVVETGRPLAPSQAMAIREIVDQVYQATEPYKPMPESPGFLGVLMSDPSVIVEAADPDSPAGVIVIGRIKGFCAYRQLQDGDVILQVNDQRVRADNDLMEVIRKCKGGDVVLMHILRGGQQMDVSVTLAARPIWAQQIPTMEDFKRERQRKSDDYWEKNFAPLLDTGLL